MHDRLEIHSFFKPIRSSISLFGDKSISHRALIVSALSRGVARISGFLHSGDCVTTLRALRGLGVRIAWDGGTEVTVHGLGLRGLSPPESALDMGNSGTSMRLLAGVLAAQNFSSELTGDDSLRKRPMKRIIEPLTMMGARIKAQKKGYPPLHITGTGKLKPIEYVLPIPSAQVKSSILLAGLSIDDTTTVIEPLPSRDHTERMLQYLGADMILEYPRISLHGGREIRARDILIPGDISSAAFFIAAATLSSEACLELKNLCLNPTRTGVLDVLKRMGARIEIQQRGETPGGEPVGDLIVWEAGGLHGVEISGDIIPRVIDEIPVLAVMASMAEGKTVIKDARELRVKECDRIAAMTINLRKMGVRVEEMEDGMIIEGREELVPAEVDSWGDHRIAMAMVIAGLFAGGKTVVHRTSCINTSFPGFMEILNKLIRVAG